MSAARTKLAGLVNTVATHAKSVTNVAEKQITTRYSKMMEANKEYVVEDQAKASKLFKQWYYTNMSRWASHAHAAPGRLTMHRGAAPLPQPLKRSLRSLKPPSDSRICLFWPQTLKHGSNRSKT